MSELPKDFTARLIEMTGESRASEIMESYTQLKPTTFRANTLKISADELEAELKTMGISAKRVAWYREAFILDGDSQILTKSELFDSGKIYVQSLSSMVPALLLDAQPDELVLDICAAPGSKTTQIAAMMKNTGQIVANDLSTVRLYKLAYNLKLQGVVNTKTYRSRGEELWKRYQRKFDRCLADVPCSMEGRFSLLDEKSYAQWSEKKVKDLAQRMKYLLWSAVQCTHSGGTIVYSTCTTAPEENEGVVNWVLDREGGKLEVQEIKIEGLATDPGLTAWRNAQYREDLNKAARIYPSQTMEGFFVCVLKVI